MFEATSCAVPRELYWSEIGLVLKFASQIMSSLTLDPPALSDKNKSKATSATTEVVEMDHVQEA